MTVKKTMKALLLDDYTQSTFSPKTLDVPTPAPGEVLVKIKAVGVNPIDFKIRKGLAPYAMPELPAIIGTDLAGVVEQVGEGVTAYVVGDEVFGLTGGVRGIPGSLAEFSTVDADLLAKKPTTLSWRQAAALPLVCLTAWEGLVDKAMVRTGQKVLIHGGAGGVGHVAVQIARAFGAEVYATASSGKLDLVQKLGATAIDYTSTTVEDYVAEYTDGKGFDIIYDTVGGPVLDASFEAVCDYGHIVSCAAFAEHNLAPSSLRAATISGVFVLLPMLSGNKRAHHGEILRKVAEMADSGELFPIVDAREFTLDTAVEAHDAVEAGSAAIKVVIDIAV